MDQQQERDVLGVKGLGGLETSALLREKGPIVLVPQVPVRPAVGKLQHIGRHGKRTA